MVEFRDAKITELEAKVKELSAAKPGMSSGAGGTTEESTPREETHLAAARRFF